MGHQLKILENGLMMIPNLQFFSMFLRLFINQFIGRWSKPASGLLVAGMLVDLTRSQTDLVIENALLRQQLIDKIRHLSAGFYYPQSPDPTPTVNQ